MAIALRPFSVSSAFDDVSGAPKHSFWGLSKLSPIPLTSLAACRCESRSSNNYDRIPREFRDENLKEGCKPKEEIKKNIELPRHCDTQEAIAYGIADKIIKPEDDAFEEKNYDEQLGDQKP